MSVIGKTTMEGKGIIYYNSGDRYEMIGKMIKGKEKEYNIIMMVIDMKEILKMINLKEKEYFIIIMVIDMKVILKIVNLKE